MTRTLTVLCAEAFTLLVMWAMILLLFMAMGCTTARIEVGSCVAEIEHVPWLQGEQEISTQHCTVQIRG